MYYFMFYAGLLGFVVSLISSIYIFFKKDVAESVRTIFKLYVLAFACMGVMAVSAVTLIKGGKDVSFCECSNGGNSRREEIDRREEDEYASKLYAIENVKHERFAAGEAEDFQNVNTDSENAASSDDINLQSEESNINVDLGEDASDKNDAGDKENGVLITLAADDEKQQAYVFEGEDASGPWTAEGVKLRLNIHDENGIERVSVKVGEGEDEVIEYSGEKEETKEADGEGGLEGDEEGATDKAEEPGEKDKVPDKEEDYAKDVEKYIDVAESSVDSFGVCVKVMVDSMSGERTEIKRWIHIDTTLPTGAITGYKNDRGGIDKQEDIVYSNQRICVSFGLEDAASGIDSKSISARLVPAGSDMEHEGTDDVTPVIAAEGKGYNVYIPDGDSTLAYDGYVVIRARDMAGNETTITSDRIIYSKGAPDIVLDTEYEFGKWTNKDVVINVVTSARECGIKRIAYYVSGKKISEEVFKDIKYENSYELRLDKPAEKKSGYSVEVRAYDNCGNESRKKEKVYIDKEAPSLSVSGAVNGTHYSGNVPLKLEISDVLFNATELKCDITRSLDGRVYEEKGAAITPKSYSDHEELMLSREGEYTVNVSAVDGAGNKSELPELSFVIDKNAPQISIAGVEDNDVTRSDVRVDFLCEESFYETGTVSIDVERSIGGKQEKESLDIFEHNEMKELKRHVFSKEGEYDITMSAKDKAGNEAEQVTLHFTLDKTAPEISFAGVKPYAQSDKRIDVRLNVKEEFFEDGNVSLVGSLSKMDGGERAIKLPEMSIDSKSNYLNLSFDMDGRYAIAVNAKDKAGNTSRKKICFLIDTHAPEISGLENIDGQYLRELKLDENKEEMFKDLTLKSCGLSINGMEYGGEINLTQEGRYELLAYAEDELGHRSEESAEFVIDNSAPEILFTGIRDGDVVYEPGEISWRTYDTEDRITGIVINDEECDVNLRELRYNTFGAYKVQIKGIDKAGNEGVSTIAFEYAAPRKGKATEGQTVADVSHSNARAVIAVSVIASLSVILVMVLLKKRKAHNIK